MDAGDFRRLTNPHSVAVVGASETLGSYGWRVLKILLDYGQDRQVYAVNARRAGELIQGVRAHGCLRDLPEAPECTVVVVPPPAVPDVLRDMAAVGSRTGLVLSAPHTAGAETARAFDQQVSELASELGLCLLGPNSMGLMSPAHGFAATFASGMLTNPGDADPAPAGGIAMISQSGAAISFLLEEHRGRGIGYSHLVSTGNEIVVDFNDVVECVADDAATHTIVLFMEAIRDGRRLRGAVAAAREAGKAVVIMRIGSTAAGKAAAQSHSGRLAGDTAPYRALADDVGAIYVESYQHLFDSFRVLNAFPPTDPRLRWSDRRTAAIITSSGGAAVVAIDELGKHGWTVPSLSPQLRKRLDDLLGEQGHDNPLDLLGLWKDDWRMAKTVRTLADSGELDSVIIAMGGGGPNAAQVCRRAAEVATSADVRIPVVFANLGLRQDAQHVLEGSGVAMLSDLTRAVRGLEDRLLVAGIGPVLPAHQPGPEGDPSPGAGLPAGEVLDRLAAAGVSCAPSHVIGLQAGAEEFAAAAQELGYPVAVKIEHPQLLHKSDVGGVVVDVRSGAELGAAVEQLRAVAGTEQLAGAKVVVQAMMRGIEVIVGARRDESFGQVLVIGLGGTLAELVDDVRLTLLPTTRDRIAEIVARHERLSALLAGHRGTKGDVDALVAQIFAIAQWVSAQEKELIEFDANPLTVTPDGAYVVDARAVVEGGAR